MDDDLVMHVAAVNATLVAIVTDLAMALSDQGLLPPAYGTAVSKSLKGVAELIEENLRGAYGDDVPPNSTAVLLQGAARVLEGRAKG